MAQNISPSHFQLYEVLEPIKSPLNPDNNVGILIDKDDDKDKQNDIELSGSDLDSIKKSDFDLVDLYQNIYVTPHHVRKPEKIVKPPQIDYNEFLENLEEGKKIDWTNSQMVLKESPLNTTVADEINCRSKVNILKDDKMHEKSSFAHDILNSYDITRVLEVPASIQLSQKMYHVNKEKANMTKIMDNYNKFTCDCEMKNRDISRTNKELSTNILNINKAKTLTGINPISKSFNNDIASMLEKPFKAIDISKISVQTPIQNTIEQNNVRFSNVCSNNLTKADTELPTVKLDKKTHVKLRQVKSEIQKLGYTKGPDLHEKSVVLPQIMKRLAARNQALEQNANITKRLILDTGNQKKGCQCQSEKIASKSSNDPKLGVQESLQDKGKQASVHVSLSNPGSSSDRYSPQNIEVKLKPVIALENCNQERLLAHQIRSAFQKYVLTGTYY